MGRAWQRLRWTAATWIFRLIIQVGRRLPTRLCYAAAAPVADLCYYGFRCQRRNLVANLTDVLGDRREARAAGRRCFRNFSKYVIDFFQLATADPRRLVERIEFDEWARLDEALAGPEGVIFVTIHLGQWEMGAAALAAHGRPLSVLAEPIEHGPMDDLVQGFRAGLNMAVIPPDRGAARRALAVLRGGGALASLIDVVGPGQDVQVSFFGRRTRLSAVPARLALHTGARVIPAVLPRAAGAPEKVRPALDFDLRYPPGRGAEAERALTQALARSLERLMRPHLDQWYVFHRFWPTSAATARPAARRDLRGEAKYWTMRGAAGLLAWLPLGPSYAIADRIGDAAFALRRGVRANLIDNMRHVLGPAAPHSAVRRTARVAMRNVCRYYVDLIRLPRVSPAELLRRRISITGLENVRHLLREGRGVVITSAHYGDPEVAAQVGPSLGLDVLVIAEPLRPPALAALVQRLRTANGARYQTVGYRAMSEALRHLRAGGLVAIACDRDIQSTGAQLPFFGVLTRMPLGAAELALRTGAAIVPGYCRRRGQALELVFEPEVEVSRGGDHDADVRTTAQRVLERAEGWLREEPGQWIVLERVWEETRPDEGLSDSVHSERSEESS